MPAFQSLQLSGGPKRKSESAESEYARKKQALGEGSSRGGGTTVREQYWTVQWRNPQYKKHKTWDGDAVMAVEGFSCRLYDMDGKPFISGKLSGVEGPHQIAEETMLTVAGKDINVDSPVSRDDFLSGRIFGKTGMPSSSPLVSSKATAKQFVPLRPKTMNTVKSSPSATDRGDEQRNVVLEPVDLISASEKSASKVKVLDSFWSANWRKPQQKKHKTWEGDAFLTQRGEKLLLVSDKGVVMGTKKWDGLPLYSSWKGLIGGKEVELDHQVSQSEVPKIVGRSREADEEVEVVENPSVSSQRSFLATARRESANGGASVAVDPPQSESSGSAAKAFVPPKSFYGQPPPKPKPKGPLHDPDAAGAIVMKAPTKEHIAKYNKKDLPVVPVVVDPLLARHLRPHQVEGVKFLYECVMGLRKHEGQGCILADEMGMGKTLQTIALCWTLLKQNPYAGKGGVVGKILIVCPVSLINNWKNEFHKWLGKDRVGVFVGDKDKVAIKQFINSRIHQVLVIGYERLRSVIEDLAYCDPPIGLIICDEGHRLKSANNKTSTMFEALRTPRRVILSGTPIQNDLSEFHAMADFCNPSLLDDYNTFRRVYENPILKSRAPGCTEKEKELGEARSAQLTAIARSFVLRREATILKKYLPPKHEYVVFVTPTKLQLAMFTKILTANRLDDLVRNSTAESLALINLLTKISNSPILLKATLDHAKSKGGRGDMIKQNAIEEALTLLPSGVQVEDVSLSGKLTALASLLRALRKNTEEKCIVVSHYTSTLNIVEAFCKKKGYTYHRLDGQTPAPKRQEYVNDFNKTAQSKRFVFLLSSKAGGVGLNLIGASRLVLIDSDWNPSHDLQSMARIHRDGQKRPVFIYRFLTAGAIDEKIYQRQVTKLGLSDSLMGTGTSESKSDSFTRKDLRDIFTIHAHTTCNTHDLLECPCDGLNRPMKADDKEEDGMSESEHESSDEEDDRPNFVVASQVKPEQIEKMDKAYIKQKKAQLAALGEWTHIDCLKPEAGDHVHDDILRGMLFTRETEQKAVPESRSRLDSLLDAIDLETVLAANPPPLTVDDVPGGTVSFLFERTDSTVAEASEDVAAEDEP